MTFYASWASYIGFLFTYHIPKFKYYDLQSLYVENNFEIKKFKNKIELFKHLRKRFSENRIILIHGSTAHKKVKNFSDFDIEVYGKIIKKPYYELVFINRKPALLTTLFYKYQNGEKKTTPQNIRMIKGEYTNAIKNRKPHTMYSEGAYNSKEKIKRECQLVIDFLFKYLRSKDIQYLRYIQKRII